MNVLPLELLRRVLYAAVIAGGLLIASMLISALTPAFVQLIARMTGRLAEFRDNLLRAAGHGLGRRWSEFWDERQRHPRRPLVVQLDRIADATEGLSTRQAAVIAKLQDDVINAVENIGRARIEPQGHVSIQAAGFVDATIRARRVLALFFFLAIVTCGLVAFNTAMLNEFLEAFLGSGSLLPYPLPQTRFTLILALFLALFEVACGVVLHAIKDFGNEHPVLDAGRYMAYFGIVAFAVTEAIAYAVLSGRIDVPRLLGVTDDSAFYPLLRYFLAAIGVTVPPMLALLGYAAWAARDEWSKATSERKAKRSLERMAATAESINQRIQQAQSKLESLHTQAAGFRPNLIQAFRDAVGAGEECTSVASYLRGGAKELLSQDGSEIGRPQVRTRPHVLAAILVDLLMLGIYAVLGWILASTLYTVVTTRYPESRAVAFSVSLVLTAGLGLMGYLARDAYVGSSYAAAVQSALPEPKARRSALFVIAGLSALGIVVSAWIAAGGVLIGDHVLLNGLFGFFLAATFTALSWNMDACLVAVAGAAYLIGIGAVWGAVLIIYTLCFLAEAALGFIAWVIEILSVPGRWALGLFRPRAVPQG